MDEDADDPLNAIRAYSARILSAYADFRAGKATRADIQRAMAMSILHPEAPAPPRPAPGSREWRENLSRKQKEIWARKRAEKELASKAKLPDAPKSEAQRTAEIAMAAPSRVLVHVLPEDGMRDLIDRANAEGCSAEEMAVRLVMAGLGYEFVPAHFAKKGSP